MNDPQRSQKLEETAFDEALNDQGQGEMSKNVRELFSVVEHIQEQKKNIVPSAHLLNRILSEVSSEIKPRQQTRHFFSFHFSDLVSSYAKILLPVGVTAIILTLGTLLWYGSSSRYLALENKPLVEEAIQNEFADIELFQERADEDIATALALAEIDTTLNAILSQQSPELSEDSSLIPNDISDINENEIQKEINALESDKEFEKFLQEDKELQNIDNTLATI